MQLRYLDLSSFELVRLIKILYPYHHLVLKEHGIRPVEACKTVTHLSGIRFSTSVIRKRWWLYPNKLRLWAGSVLLVFLIKMAKTKSCISFILIGI